MAGPLGQLQILCSRKPPTICCGLQPQFNELSIFEKELLLRAAVNSVKEFLNSIRSSHEVPLTAYRYLFPFNEKFTFAKTLFNRHRIVQNIHLITTINILKFFKCNFLDFFLFLGWMMTWEIQNNQRSNTFNRYKTRSIAPFSIYCGFISRPVNFC